jgi:HD-GYP domain-containing protein (c-di-GMP phosphodiesterase class II)
MMQIVGAMMQIKELGDVVAAVGSEPELEAYQVARQEEGWVELRHDEQAAVLVLPEVWGDPGRLAEVCGEGAGALLVCLGRHDEITTPPPVGAGRHQICLTFPTTPAVLRFSLDAGLEMLIGLHQARSRGQLAERYQYELGEIISIAKSINSERDIDRLLGLILEKSRYVTGADAGSVYVLHRDADEPEKRQLRFRVAQNESLEVDFEAFTIEVSERSIVGAAVIRREIINIPDLYDLERHNPWGVEHDRSFDEHTGYQTRAVLTVPLINQRDQVIGVLQLINKKTTPGVPLKHPEDFKNVVPFDEHAVELCRTLASQAGISLDNALLYTELQEVFEGFVKASVQAIEARDPTTSGHSQRVADLTVELAKVVDRESAGPYKVETFTDEQLKAIQYAGLLHDFGKIGVPEAVLVKAMKLYDWEREVILARFDYIKQWTQNDVLQKKLELALKQGATSKAMFGSLDGAMDKRLEYLELCLNTVLEANRPTVMDGDRPQLLQEISQQTYVDPRGETKPFLYPDELECLSILRGSLNTDERDQIQSHVVHTYNYLRTIPWGVKFHSIPSIAGAHHEKLDGTGYPNGIPENDIPVEAKMMTIADIFDALTASDRPYKRALPVDRALDILKHDVAKGKLDQELFRLFIEAGVYKLVL